MHFDNNRSQFTLLLVSPVKFIYEGLLMLHKEIYSISASINPHGYLKYPVTGADTRETVDCKEIKELYNIHFS